MITAKDLMLKNLLKFTTPRGNNTMGLSRHFYSTNADSINEIPKTVRKFVTIQVYILPVNAIEGTRVNKETFVKFLQSIPYPSTESVDHLSINLHIIDNIHLGYSSRCNFITEADHLLLVKAHETFVTGKNCLQKALGANNRFVKQFDNALINLSTRLNSNIILDDSLLSPYQYSEVVRHYLRTVYVATGPKITITHSNYKPERGFTISAGMYHLNFTQDDILAVPAIMLKAFLSRSSNRKISHLTLTSGQPRSKKIEDTAVLTKRKRTTSLEKELAMRYLNLPLKKDSQGRRHRKLKKNSTQTEVTMTPETL